VTCARQHALGAAMMATHAVAHPAELRLGLHMVEGEGKQSPAQGGQGSGRSGGGGAGAATHLRGLVLEGLQEFGEVVQAGLALAPIVGHHIRAAMHLQRQGPVSTGA
jgi:hypothetical protein